MSPRRQRQECCHKTLLWDDAQQDWNACPGCPLRHVWCVKPSHGAGEAAAGVPGTPPEASDGR